MKKDDVTRKAVQDAALQALRKKGIESPEDMLDLSSCLTVTFHFDDLGEDGEGDAGPEEADEDESSQDDDNEDESKPGPSAKYDRES